MNDKGEVIRRTLQDITMDIAADMLVRSLTIVNNTAYNRQVDWESRCAWMIENYPGWDEDGRFTFPDGYIMDNPFQDFTQVVAVASEPMPPKKNVDPAFIDGRSMARPFLGGDAEADPLPGHIIPQSDADGRVGG